MEIVEDFFKREGESASFEKRVGLRGFGGGQGRAEPGAANP
jgi:hypothetical protein